MSNCTKCKYAVLEDYGYSNWTVEGTTFSCAKKAHPAAPFDNFYGKAPEYKLVELCPFYEEGFPLSVDVDRTDLYNFNEEELSIWKEHLNE